MDGSKVCPFGTSARPHPGHLPLRPLPPMESAIRDVYSHLNRPGVLPARKNRRWVGISGGSTPAAMPLRDWW
jgi:hypothetical protein